MDNNSGCAKIEQIMMKYMDGAITSRESEQLRLHTEACEECARDLEIYERMLAAFAEETFVQAPKNFEVAVMAKIALLPQTRDEEEGRHASAMCVVCGTFSVLSGAGMMLFINSESITSWALADAQLAPYVEAVQPLSEAYTASMAQLVGILEAAMATCAAYAPFMQVTLTAIFGVLALAQFLLYRRDKVKSTIGQL